MKPLLLCLWDQKTGKQGARVDGAMVWWPMFRLPTVEVRRHAHVSEQAVRELMERGIAMPCDCL